MVNPTHQDRNSRLQHLAEVVQGQRPHTHSDMVTGMQEIFCAVVELILKKFPENNLLYRRQPIFFFSAVNQVFVLSATKRNETEITFLVSLGM